jgi:hypothetical protein
MSTSVVVDSDYRTDGKRAVKLVTVRPASRNGDDDRLEEIYATERIPNAGSDVLGRPVGHVVAPEDRLPIVTDWSGMKDFVNAPPSYDVFYRQYLAYTKWLVTRFGVPASDLDDVVIDIIMRFMERDSIGVFSGEWSTRSATGKSNFRSYYSRFVVTYARGKNRNVHKHNSRNLLICDASVDDDGSTSWLDVNAPTSSFEEDAVGSMDFDGLVSSLRARVKPELADAVDAVVEMSMGAPSIKVAELARKLGVSQRVANDQLAAVRSVLGSLVGSR